MTTDNGGGLGPELQSAFQDVAILKTFADTVKDRTEAAKARLLELTSPGDRKSVRDADGVAIATISRTEPKGTLKVVDEEAFTTWVKEHHPSNIMETVRPAFVKALDTVVERNGGELPPGVDVKVGEPVLVVRQSAEQREAAINAITVGSLQLSAQVRLELPSAAPTQAVSQDRGEERVRACGEHIAAWLARSKVTDVSVVVVGDTARMEVPSLVLASAAARLGLLAPELQDGNLEASGIVNGVNVVLFAPSEEGTPAAA